MTSQAVQGAVIGRAVQTPESGFTDIGQPRTELKTQQPKEAKNNVRLTGRVGHQLFRFERRLILE